MSQSSVPQITWLDSTAPHDYDAADSYLSLLMPQHAEVVDLLKNRPVVEYKAKDIFRAAALPLLGKDNYHVGKDIQKIQAGKKLSPILLVVDNRFSSNLIIADGYHRMCAIYSFNEDISIRCQIVYLSPANGVVEAGA